MRIKKKFFYNLRYNVIKIFHKSQPLTIIVTPISHNPHIKEQHLRMAHRFLSEICIELHTSDQVKETGWSLFKEAFETGAIRGYPIESMVCACVYAAARIKKLL